MKIFQNVLIPPNSAIQIGDIEIYNPKGYKIISVTEDPLQLTFTNIETEYNGQSAVIGIQYAPGADSEKNS